MTDFIFGSLDGDLQAADAALIKAIDDGDLLEQQRACAFALAAVQRAFPFGKEYGALARLSSALQRVIDGGSDPLFKAVKPRRSRPKPERILDANSLMLVMLFVENGMSKRDAFVKVAKLMNTAGMTSHGGGRRPDNDSAGVSRSVSPGTMKSLWEKSLPRGDLEELRRYAQESIERLRAVGTKMDTEQDVLRIFEALRARQPLSIVELLTTPARSEV